MSSSLPTWAVVATVREPFALLAAFAAHYLSIGASEVHLFVDQPEPGDVERLNALENVFATDANARYFLRAHGIKRPHANMRRQRINADHAYRTTKADWLLHVDADEFLQPGALTQELAALDADIDVLRVPNGERAFAGPPQSIFDGVLRVMPDRPRRVRHLFDPVVTQFSNAGFTGHAMGKSLTRTGRNYRIGIHAPLLRFDVRAVTSTSAILCHFDGLTPLHWAQKLWRYVGTGIYDDARSVGRARHLQMQFSDLAQDAPERVVWLHQRLKVIAASQLPPLLLNGLVRPIELQIETAVGRLFGRGQIDLSAAAFDAVLLRNAGDQTPGMTRLAKELAASDTETADFGVEALALAASA